MFAAKLTTEMAQSNLDFCPPGSERKWKKCVRSISTTNKDSWKKEIKRCADLSYLPVINKIATEIETINNDTMKYEKQIPEKIIYPQFPLEGVVTDYKKQIADFDWCINSELSKNDNIESAFRCRLSLGAAIFQIKGERINAYRKNNFAVNEYYDTIFRPDN